jgi:hypothetical protein
MLEQFRATVRRSEEAARAAMSERVANTSPSLELTKYSGTYGDSAYGDARVWEEEGKLVIQVGTRAGELEHWHYDTFRVNWRPGRSTSLATFRIDRQGIASALSIPGFPELTRR